MKRIFRKPICDQRHPPPAQCDVTTKIIPIAYNNLTVLFSSFIPCIPPLMTFSIENCTKIDLKSNVAPHFIIIFSDSKFHKINDFRILSFNQQIPKKCGYFEYYSLTCPFINPLFIYTLT